MKRRETYGGMTVARETLMEDRDGGKEDIRTRASFHSLNSIHIE